MGYYIQTPEMKNKVEQLLKMVPGAREIGIPIFDFTGATVNVCVVDNGPFEACGVAYSRREQDVFYAPDPRNRRWLVMSRADVVKLCPDVESELVPLAGNG